MREVTLNKTGALKTRMLAAEFFLSDLESSIKSFAPGEWVKFVNPKRGESFIGFVNPLARPSSPCGYALLKHSNGEINPRQIVEDLIARAIDKRRRISDYGDSARMVYGASDNLPGLIVDSFKSCALAQINTAGLDSFRNEIKSVLEKILERDVHLLDNPLYREAEALPMFEKDWEIDSLEIEENDLRYNMSAQNLQKVGFYYDHRENRKKLENYINRIKNTELKRGLDLFCYAGAWGMTMARAGVSEVSLVDQGNFEDVVANNWKNNGLKAIQDFKRANVFDFLKESESQGERFDIIVSDPPAFCKSPKGVKKALEGYLKLHRACLRLLPDKSFLAACSCTHYVDMDAFIQNVNMAAKQEGVKLTMLDLGSQGFDHPSSGLNDRANYLKYVLFYVEKL